MIDGLIHGLALVVQWPAIFYLVLGVILGLWLGAVPGLGGILGLVIILPFTFDMDAISAFALLLGLFAVTTTGDTIASVLLGIPGTAASQATILDGYPLAQKGEALRAFGAAFTVSAIGGAIGAVVMAISLPIALPIILSFGSPDFFLLGLLGLTMVGTVSGAAVSKGLAAALVGLMLSQIGYPEAAPEPRYWFHIQFLIDGLPLVPVVLGLFAVPELLELAARNTSISRVPQAEGSGMLEGIKDAFRHKWLMLRCSAIGIYIGMLPGLGGTIADWIAYGHAVQSTKPEDNPRFGDGDIRGVIAPESANNALKGGVLIPTVAIGIPGNVGTAILLGALLIQGVNPGRDMLTTHIDLTFAMVWTLVIANLLGAGLLMLWSRQVAKVAFIDGHLLVPGVIVFVLMGGWLQLPNLDSWWTLLGMAVLGFVMKRSGWPRPPLVLGFVLGPIMENALVISTQRYELSDLLTAPVTFSLAVIVLVAFFFAVRGTRRAKRLGHLSDMAEGARQCPLLSLPLSLLLFGVFIAAFVMALDWPLAAKLFPMTIAAAAIVLVGAAVAQDAVALSRQLKSAAGSLIAVARESFGGDYYRRATCFLAWLAAAILLTPVLGQQAALVVFGFLYMLVWGRYRWYWAALYAGCIWLVLYLLYDQILHTFWITSLLGD